MLNSCFKYEYSVYVAYKTFKRNSMECWNSVLLHLVYSVGQQILYRSFDGNWVSTGFKANNLKQNIYLINFLSINEQFANKFIFYKMTDFQVQLGLLKYVNNSH